MSRNTQHAKALAAIAAQVVESHRQHPAGETAGIEEMPIEHEASGFHYGDGWDYTLPEEYQA